MRRSLAGAFFCAASGVNAVDHASCNSRFQAPDPGENVMALNGVHLPDTCISTHGTHEVFIIGDWGGVDSGDEEKGPVPADHRADGVHKRGFVNGIDDRAQHEVRNRMIERAAEVRPEYVLNVGDNFYWGGVEKQCGKTRDDLDNFSWQWDAMYEDFYAGEGIEGVQWLGCLGNHDYGGFQYSSGWDQTVLYTWKEPGHGRPMRWVTPALYWQSTVHYLDFSVDYVFLDTNIFDARDTLDLHGINSNICSFLHNPIGTATRDCSAEGGPSNVFNCHQWFQQLWEEQKEWLHLQLSQSRADWQVVVTHFPPNFEKEFWTSMTVDYGIDMFITGHLHRQEVWGDSQDNFLAPTVVVVSGGGGGITSDYMPSLKGNDQYGYMRMTLSKDTLEVVNIMHTGVEGDRAVAVQRPCENCTEKHVRENTERVQKGFLERGRLGHPRKGVGATPAPDGASDATGVPAGMSGLHDTPFFVFPKTLRGAASNADGAHTASHAASAGSIINEARAMANKSNQTLVFFPSNNEFTPSQSTVESVYSAESVTKKKGSKAAHATSPDSSITEASAPSSEVNQGFAFFPLDDELTPNMATEVNPASVFLPFDFELTSNLTAVTTAYVAAAAPEKKGSMAARAAAANNTKFGNKILGTDDSGDDGSDADQTVVFFPFDGGRDLSLTAGASLHDFAVGAAKNGSMTGDNSTSSSTAERPNQTQALRPLDGQGAKNLTFDSRVSAAAGAMPRASSMDPFVADARAMGDDQNMVGDSEHMVNITASSQGALLWWKRSISGNASGIFWSAAIVCFSLMMAVTFALGCVLYGARQPESSGFLQLGGALDELRRHVVVEDGLVDSVER